MVGTEGISQVDLEVARGRMSAAEDRLDAARSKQHDAATVVGRLIAGHKLRVAGREVHDSGEHLGMIEDLAFRLSHPEGTDGL